MNATLKMPARSLKFARVCTTLKSPKIRKTPSLPVDNAPILSKKTLMSIHWKTSMKTLVAMVSLLSGPMTMIRNGTQLNKCSCQEAHPCANRFGITSSNKGTKDRPTTLHGMALKSTEKRHGQSEIEIEKLSFFDRSIDRNSKHHM